MLNPLAFQEMLKRSGGQAPFQYYYNSIPPGFIFKVTGNQENEEGLYLIQCFMRFLNLRPVHTVVLGGMKNKGNSVQKFRG